MDSATRRKEVSFPQKELEEIVLTQRHPGVEIERIREFKELTNTQGYYFGREQYDAEGAEAQEAIYFYSAKVVKMLSHWPKSDDEFQMVQRFAWYNPLTLSYGQFLPTIALQASQEQKDRWLNKIKSFQIIGAYAQTELGHGSNVKGLETTATFDQQDSNFEIHSPTRTSTKWWPGTMGVAANHAAVFAKLIINGKNYGLHSFLVPIRDMDTHLPLPGIEVGVIGPLLGFQAPAENGYLRFNHFKIPRENLLAKFVQVGADGSYTADSTALSKAMYSSMLVTRKFLVAWASRQLSKALLIAMRYSHFRVQFGEPEKQVISYQYQQHRLLYFLSMTFATLAGGAALSTYYTQHNEQMYTKTGRDLLSYAHAVSSALKAVYSWDTSTAIDGCHQCCGGHGFSLYSGIPAVYLILTPMTTFEGDNVVLLQQVARYLLKSKKGVARQVNSSDIDSPKFFAEVFDNAQNYLVNRLAGKVTNWNSEAQILAVEVGKIFGVAYTNSAFVEFISQVPSEETRVQLENLRQIYAIRKVQEFSVSVLAGQVLSSEVLLSLSRKLEDLYKKVAPQALNLIEAQGIDDWELQSAIGQFDASPYETLFNWAKESTLNDSNRTEALHAYLIRPKL